MLKTDTQDRATPVPQRDDRVFRARATDLASQTVEYSRFVRVAKILLPSSAAGLFLIVVLFSAFHSALGDFKLPVGEVRKLAGELEMANPTLTFTDENNRAFFVNADRATQKGSKELWQLRGIRGRMTPPEGAGYKLTSETGRLDASKKLLDLAGRVLVVSEKGYRFEARSAHVDMNDNRVTSEEPVKASQGPTTIDSDRFEMWDKGSKLRFEGRVKFVSESAPRTAPPDPDDGETP